MRRRQGFEQQGGQSLVELAVALPLLLVLTLGIFDAGRVVIGYTTLTNAVRAGARVAIVNQSNAVSCDAARTFKCAAADQAVALGIAPGAVPDLVVSGSDCALTGSCSVTVSLTHAIDLVTPLVGAVMGPFTLSTSATMPLERAHSSP